MGRVGVGRVGVGERHFLRLCLNGYATVNVRNIPEWMLMSV